MFLSVAFNILSLFYVLSVSSIVWYGEVLFWLGVFGILNVSCVQKPILFPRFGAATLWLYWTCFPQISSCSILTVLNVFFWPLAWTLLLCPELQSYFTHCVPKMVRVLFLNYCIIVILWLLYFICMLSHVFYMIHSILYWKGFPLSF